MDLICPLHQGYDISCSGYICTPKNSFFPLHFFAIFVLLFFHFPQIGDWMAISFRWLYSRILCRLRCHSKSTICVLKATKTPQKTNLTSLRCFSIFNHLSSDGAAREEEMPNYLPMLTAGFFSSEKNLSFQFSLQ